MDWWGLLKQILPYLSAGVGGAVIDNQNAQTMIDPQDAANQMTGRYDTMMGMLNNTMQGQTQSPNLQAARDRFTQRLNTPINAPQVFNPYKQNPQYGQPNQQLMQQMLSLAQPNSQNTQATNWMMQSLRNRNTPRPMGG
jgi:hypothetical protein